MDPEAKRRNVYLTSKFAPFSFNPLEEHEWLGLQTKLGCKLAPNVRKKLTNCTAEFAKFAMDPHSAMSWADLQHKISMWQTKTVHFGRTIWKDPPIRKLDSGSRGIKVAQIERLFDQSLSPFEARYPLAYLSRVLTGAVLASSLTAQRINSQFTANSRDTELWFLWAAIVFGILREGGIEVKHPHRKELLSGPVQLLYSLQQKLPKQFQRRTGKSLRRAAVRAYFMSRKATVSYMSKVLSRWGKGDILFARDGSDPTFGNMLFRRNFARFIAATTNSKTTRK